MSGRQKVQAGDQGNVQIGRRAHQRLRVFLSATLHTTTRQYAVTMRNLSTGGALIEAPELPSTGRTVILRRGNIDALATVIWAEPRLCGLEFYDPITDDEVLHHLQTAPDPTLSAVRDYFWRMREGSDRLSAEEWEAMKLSVHRNGFVSKN